ncbi:MAG TPA: ATP-binding protein, partial [Acidimicrobiales bacterium]|nr:ATP-binding protein [Acidimicrobiales bacterium]
VGTLCIIDRVPRQLDERERALLADLAHLVEQELGSVELARATAALAESEARVAGILSSVAEGVATFALDSTVLSFNPAAEVMFGWSEAEIVGRPITDIVHPDDVPVVLDLLAERAASETGEEVHVTVRGLRRDATHFEMEVSASELLGSDGQVFIAVARDVSDISALRRRTDLILQSAGDGIVLLDLDGLVTFVNPAAAEMLRVEPHAIVGAHLHDAAHHMRPDGTPYPWEECPTYRSMRDNEIARSDTETYYRADGTPFGIEYTSAPTVDDGRVTGAVVVFSDISSRREVERLKDQFVSIVSHELRTPLTSIQGSLGLVAGGVLGEIPPEPKEMIDVALANTTRLARLVNDILDLERIATGHLDLVIEACDGADLVHAAVGSTAGAADAAGVRIELDAPSTPMLADADRIIQALTNLIGNAVKFSAAGSTVEVRIEATADAVTFCVCDHGRGIPPDKLESIFERFQQVDIGDRREKGGTGLGLPITRSIARQHGGDVSVESELGRGSTLQLTIPRREAP